jgi:hypothetical protein
MEHTLLYPLDTVKTCWQSQVLHKVSGKSGCGPCEISSFVSPDTIPSNTQASASVSTMKKGSLGTTYGTTNPTPPHSNSIWSTVKHLMKHSHNNGSHHAAGVTTLASQTHGMLAPNVVDMANSAGQNATQGRCHPRHSKTNRPWSKQSRMIRNATVADLAPNLAPSQFNSNITSQSASTKAGIQRLFRGVQSMFVGCIPAHALYFSSYEIIKTMSLEYNKSNSSASHCHGTM